MERRWWTLWTGSVLCGGTAVLLRPLTGNLTWSAVTIVVAVMLMLLWSLGRRSWIENLSEAVTVSAAGLISGAVLGFLILPSVTHLATGYLLALKYTVIAAFFNCLMIREQRCMPLKREPVVECLRSLSDAERTQRLRELMAESSAALAEAKRLNRRLMFCLAGGLCLMLLALATLFTGR